MAGARLGLARAAVGLACLVFGAATLRAQAPDAWVAGEETLRAAGAQATDRATADAALADTFTLQGVTARQPRRPIPAGQTGQDGQTEGAAYDWDWRGPRDDPEWAWFFNRHAWFPALLAAHRETLAVETFGANAAGFANRDTPYAAALLATLDDWIVTHPAPGRLTFSAAWRPLEAARRLLHSWLPIADALPALPGVSPALLARFEASLVAHGEHLAAHHAFGGNHLVTEMLALTRLALARPDLPGADRWLAYGLDQLTRAYDDQVYPDGAHVELSTHYQRVIALNYQMLLDRLRAAGRADLVAIWTPRVERLWRYFAVVMTPGGGNPLNNDSDREDVRGLLAAHAPALLASPPVPTPPTAPTASAVHLPWAGQTVWRGGPSAAPHWAFFQAGPRGTDHDHADHLQLDLALGAREFLVDSGRYTYAPGPWRDYFAGPTGHNVLLLDGRGADPQPRRVSVLPSATPRFREAGRFSWAWGDATFSAPGQPRAGDWRRIVVYVRDAGWVVIDRVVSFGAHTLTTQWHWAPEVEAEPSTAPSALASPWLARVGATALEITPPALIRADAAGAWRVTRGLETPSPRGWFSPRFNIREPATQTDFVQRLRGPRLNVWVFRPVASAAGSASVGSAALAEPAAPAPASDDAPVPVLRAEWDATTGLVRFRLGARAWALDPEAPGAPDALAFPATIPP